MINYDAIESELGPDIANALRLLAAQRAKGIPKYGCGLEDNKALTTRSLVQHAREELADGLCYLTRLDAMHAEELDACKRDTAMRVLQELRECIASTGGASDEFRLMAVWDWIANYECLVGPDFIKLNVQPSELSAWLKGQANLLTLSRSSAFPFTHSVMVKV